MRALFILAVTFFCTATPPQAQALDWQFWNDRGWGWYDYDFKPHMENRFTPQQHQHRYQWSHGNERPDETVAKQRDIYAQMVEMRILRAVKFNYKEQVAYAHMGAPFHRLSYRDKEHLVTALDGHLFANHRAYNAHGKNRVLRLVDYDGDRIIGTFSAHGFSLR